MMKTIYVSLLAVLVTACGSKELEKPETLSLSTTTTTQTEESLEAPNRLELIEQYNQTFANPEFPCQPDQLDSIPEAQKMKIYQIDEDHELIQLLCNTFAYQSSDIFFMNRKPLAVDLFMDDQLLPTFELVFADYDPEQRTINTFAKGRGLGDCGDSALYTWSDKFKTFELTEARAKEDCDGVYDEWPIVYPTPDN